MSVSQVDEEAIAERIERVRTQIDQLAREAGRLPASVQLIAVSKGHSADAVRAAYAAGQRVFGENYAQELEKKASALSDLSDIEWHFIGSLQRNKVKLIAPVCDHVDTVASERLLRALDQASQTRGHSRNPRPWRVMLQVNTSDEPQKSGVEAAEVGALLRLSKELPYVQVRGLMTVAVDASEVALGDVGAAEAEHVVRLCFRRLAALAEEHGVAELSMGMSHDMALAVAEGSTEVRIGTAIFGERPPRNG